jgi:F-type H+-transporting ATPase subunit b
MQYIYQNKPSNFYMELLLPGLGLLVWTLIAFLIVFIILKKFAWKPILKGLKDRENNIADSIASAEKVKAEMSQLKNENEALLAKAREERAALIKEAKENSDKMLAEAKEKAKKEYDRILADAQSAITQQKNAAITEAKGEIGKLVIEVAEKVLRKELSNNAEQEAYIKELTESVKLN